MIIITASIVIFVMPSLSNGPALPQTKLKILKACANAEQVAIALTGGEIIYFELDV